MKGSTARKVDQTTDAQGGAEDDFQRLLNHNLASARQSLKYYWNRVNSKEYNVTSGQ